MPTMIPACPALVRMFLCFPVPSGPEAIIELVQQQLPGNAKLAVFDAVTSNTALVLPIQQLVQLCRSRWVGKAWLPTCRDNT